MYYDILFLGRTGGKKEEKIKKGNKLQKEEGRKEWRIAKKKVRRDRWKEGGKQMRKIQERKRKK